ncbi:helix-turn-helix transcriptional regulator [Clostridium massiliamazoniense]|uniref:helix-turn-helix transcriptional regulator n=1 Tax=Clostridium massiliamazoniense TaxID=1347366 RepID=UPI0006D7C6E4|nr:response regulator transcription factor [Clostridium massiliamazoniense]
MVYYDLEKTYLILDLLKRYKIVNRKKLASDVKTNISYVSESVKYLRKKGYIIESNSGYNGCYIYKGKRKIKNEDKLSDIEISGIKKLYQKGIKIKDIQSIINMSKVTVFYQLNKERVDLDRVKVKLDDDRDKIIRMYSQGLSIKEIAKNLGISEKRTGSVIYTCVKGNRRNVIDNKNEILEYIKTSTESGKEIAKKFNVSAATISNLKKEIKKV